jgi:hypothetical protein
MGKDGIDLLIAIKKRPNFRTQRDCKIQDEIEGNSLGNRRSIRAERTARGVLSTNPIQELK